MERRIVSYTTGVFAFSSVALDSFADNASVGVPNPMLADVLLFCLIHLCVPLEWEGAIHVLYVSIFGKITSACRGPLVAASQ
jgi:hypothetical protein